MVSEKFWSKTIKILSDHGPNTLVFPLLFGGFLLALHADIDPSLALAGLALTYGGFLWGQSSRQAHLERMAKVEIDKIVAVRARSDVTRPKSIGRVIDETRAGK